MKFRKKPIVIEAYQTKEERIIQTLEGPLRAAPGDWIITGIRGEQYRVSRMFLKKHMNRLTRRILFKIIGGVCFPLIIFR